MSYEVKDEDLLFYDIEVFSEDAFVVFKDINHKEIAVFHNDFKGIGDVIKDKVLVGYNNYFYDDKILDRMITHSPPSNIKKINDEIINKSRTHNHNLKNRTIDCFQQISVSRPGLKRVEGNAGKMILESDVDFNINRALTDEEYQEALNYCRYDVDMTIEIYKRRKSSYFLPKWSLLDQLKGFKSEKWNTTTLSANMLTKKPLDRWSTIRLQKDSRSNDDEMNNQFFSLVPEDVKDLWLKKEKGSVTVDEFGCLIEFGFGGLHGVSKSIKRAGNVKLLDVTSMYPSILINIEGLNLAKTEGEIQPTKLFEELLEERKKIKQVDKVKSDALKLVLNSVYGLLNYEHSLLYSPNRQKSVCIYGQIALYDLCKRLSTSCKIININTDGVAFKTDSDDYKRVWKEWEQDFNLSLEEENFKTFIQKDVNNYVALDYEGNIVTKGGDVNNYHSDSWFGNNSARIIDIAIVEYLLFGTDPKITLNKNLDKPILYQYIIQSSNKFAGVVDENDKEYQNVNRIFPSVKQGVHLVKKRLDGGITKFPNTPTQMYVFNDDLDKLDNKTFRNLIDLNHYYEIIIDKLEKSWNMWQD